MRLTTKGRYAVIALVDLASGTGKSPVSLASIAERQKISGAYLEQLFLRLRKCGIVRGMRGPGGGYVLARSAGAISIAEVIRAVDEPLISHLDLSAALPVPDGNATLPRVQALWTGLGLHIHNFLDSISIEDVRLGRLPKPFAGKDGEGIDEKAVSCGLQEGEAVYAKLPCAPFSDCDA